MSKLKRALLTCALAALAAAALAAPAQAANVKAECVVSGEAKTSDKADPNIGVRVTGGKGHFFFQDLDIVCAGIAKGAPDTEIVQAEARGVYDNVVCGTGKAWGTVTRVTAEDPKYSGLLTGQKFAIHFAATVGTFFWHEWDKPKVPDVKDTVLDPVTKQQDTKVKQEKNWQAAGVIQLSAPDPEGAKPPTPPVPGGQCTKAFTASGVVTVDH